jgi:gliding motility-associated-like protein
MGNGRGSLYFGFGGGWNQQLYFNGLLDDIGIWNRALTQQEITKLYNDVNFAKITASGPTSFCQGDSVILTGNKGIKLSYQWQLNGNNIAGDTTETITATSTGIYSLVVSDTNGCKNIDSIKVEVFELPIASFLTNDTSQCLLGHHFEFTNTSYSIAGDPLTYKWHSGDNHTTNTQDYNIRFDSSGSYTIRLSVVTDQHCADSFFQTVHVHPMPIASLLTNDTAQCLLGNHFEFTNTSHIISGDSLAYEWQSGHNHTADTRDYNIRFDSSGLFTVRLSVSTNHLCADSFFQNVRVHPMPTASFLSNDTGQCLLGHHFEFTNTSHIFSGEPLSYVWQSGDGQSAKTQNFNSNYGNSGLYTVSLTVSTDFLCADTAMQTVHIYPMPKASFSVSDSNVCHSENIFDLQNHSHISDGQILLYDWDMGNGARFQTYPLVYTYPQPGRYQIQLSVKSDRGCWDSAYGTVGVYENPKALIHTDSVCLGQPTSFSSRSTSTDGTITRYRWDINGAFTSDRERFTHIFNKDGTYDVRLIVETAYGCKDTLSEKEKAVVYPNPIAKFDITKTKDSLFSTTYLMTNRSIGNGLRFEWWVSDGQMHSIRNPYIHLKDTGMTTITLKVVDQNGCEDEYHKGFLNYPENNVFIPNAFSPNNDLHNPIFNIVGVAFASQFLMEIYDRWGNKMFETKDLHQGWDGTYQGETVPPGVYVYKIQFMNLQNKFVREKGTVTLTK